MKEAVTIQSISALCEELSDVMFHVKPKQFSQALSLLEGSRRRWFFTGQGRSGLVAQMAAMRFMHLGYESHMVGEATAPSIRKNDGLLVISGSGETVVTRHFAQLARSEGAALLVLTREAESSLAKMTDVLLEVPVKESRQFGGSLFEQASLMTLDALVLALTNGNTVLYDVMSKRHTNLQ